MTDYCPLCGEEVGLATLDGRPRVGNSKIQAEHSLRTGEQVLVWDFLKHLEERHEMNFHEAYLEALKYRRRRRDD